MSFCSLIVNMIFFFFSFFFAPLLYPKAVANVIKCNMKYIAIVLGLSVISIMWYNQKEGKGIVSKNMLIGMTICYIIIVILTLLI